jgi:hypothetical protein
MEKGQYNQIGNYVFMQSEINIKVGNKAPKEYFDSIRNQIGSGKKLVSGLSTEEELLDNLEMNCVPVETMEMESKQYAEFLTIRRKLMAQKIKKYYHSL